VKAYESTADFKERLAIAERIRRGEGVCSAIGAAHAHPCVVRPTRPFDCTMAIELAEQTYNNRKQQHK